MTKPRTTQLQIREDRPTVIASAAHGSADDVLGFNITFIARKNPKIALELMRLYGEAHNITEGDPQTPEEDYALLLKQLPGVFGED